MPVGASRQKRHAEQAIEAFVEAKCLLDKLKADTTIWRDPRRLGLIKQMEVELRQGLAHLCFACFPADTLADVDPPLKAA